MSPLIVATTVVVLCVDEILSLKRYIDRSIVRSVVEVIGMGRRMYESFLPVEARMVDVRHWPLGERAIDAVLISKWRSACLACIVHKSGDELALRTAHV